MKVLDLRCAQGHGFEGWFASGDAFESQRTGGLVECPVCGDKEIAKLLSAPRLNLSGAREASVSEAPVPVPVPSSITGPNDGTSAGGVGMPADLDARAAHWMRAVRQVMARTEDVGERFPDEARKIHYGETPERAIRGRATREQAESLLDEGIDVMPLPLPSALKQTLQ